MRRQTNSALEGVHARIYIHRCTYVYTNIMYIYICTFMSIMCVCIHIYIYVLMYVETAAVIIISSVQGSGP